MIQGKLRNLTNGILVELPLSQHWKYILSASCNEIRQAVLSYFINGYASRYASLDCGNTLVQ